MKKMLTNSASSYLTPRTTAGKEKIATSQCPQCGITVDRRAHYCSKCGAALTICAKCRSINVSLGRFCHICGHSMTISSPKSEIAKVIAWQTWDFDLLDQAVLAIIKLRGGLISIFKTAAALDVSPDEINESIERLELTHEIEPG
jgi:uncharacterized OB-fold protein